jgi:DNA repair protein RadC
MAGVFAAQLAAWRRAHTVSGVYTFAAPRFADRRARAWLDEQYSGRYISGPSLRLARDLLSDSGGLSALPGMSLAMLRHGGLRDAQAAAVLAVCEIACRLARQRIPDRRPLTQPDEVARFLVLRYQQRDQEVVGALFLDLRHGLLGEKEIFRGTLHRAAVEPREILKECLLRDAGGFVLFHTHPSGDPTPRAEDLLFTRRMAVAGAVIGVDLLDHWVLGSAGCWVSLNARGGW